MAGTIFALTHSYFFHFRANGPQSFFNDGDIHFKRFLLIFNEPIGLWTSLRKQQNIAICDLFETKPDAVLRTYGAGYARDRFSYCPIVHRGKTVSENLF